MNTLSYSKTDSTARYVLELASYRLWPYEEVLAHHEVKSLVGNPDNNRVASRTLNMESSVPLQEESLKRLTFFHRIQFSKRDERTAYATSQALMEATAKVDASQEPLSGARNKELFLMRYLNGRKESNYATHGLHKFKGKFYPQLAKSLFNMANLKSGETVLDPFAGSGSALVEACLNGFKGVGIEINPLAAELANTKIQCLSLDARNFRNQSDDILDRVERSTKSMSSQNSDMVAHALGIELDYVKSWFDGQTLRKLFSLASIILSLQSKILRRFGLLVLSDILREVSLQDPRDLRIRRRAEDFSDAPVADLFRERFVIQRDRLFNFLRFREVCVPVFGEAKCLRADARELAGPMLKSQLADASVDLVLTSPPYANALPYIDTDRLSLAFLGLADRGERSKLESDLIGNREISNAERKRLEAQIFEEREAKSLPVQLRRTIFDVLDRNSNSSVGFRRKNSAALLFKYFSDMKCTIEGMYRVLKPGKHCMIIVGNNVTVAGAGRLQKEIEIRTDDFLEEIGLQVGFHARERIPITVTTEDYKHAKNFIGKNSIVLLQKPC